MPLLAIRNCVLVDFASGELRPGCGVVIEGDRIREVAQGDPRIAGAQSLDAGGRTLLPGLIDAHVHATITTMDLAAMAGRPITLVAHEARQVLEAMLRRGFTTVRDAGGADFGLAQAVERGLVRGPRILYSGRTLSQTGGHGDHRGRADEPSLCACAIHTTWFSHVADGVPAVRKAAREELRRGASQVKIMASGGVASPTDPIWNTQYSDEELRAIVEEAKSWRTYAMAHAYTPEAIARAVRAGVRSIEHGNLIDAPTARLMADARAYLVPTLVTYEKIAELGRALRFPEVSLRKVQDVLGAGLASLEIARSAGVALGFGTDLLGETHAYQSHEFAIRARAEKPLDTLRSATLVNAELLGRTGEIGAIAPGARADLILVDGNPADDPSVLDGQGEKIPFVMKGGEVFVNRLAA